MLKRMARAAYDFTPFKPFMMRTLRRIWTPPEKLFQHLHFKGPFTLDLPNGTHMRMHHFGNQIENSLFWQGYAKGWESASLLTWLWLVRDAEVVLDIGANTGVYALSAQATRPDAGVYAFEPVARIHAKLAANIALNGYPASAFKLALSDSNSEVMIYDPGGKHAYSASLHAEMLGSGTVASLVQARRLDDFANEQNIGKFDVLKVDVEMNEPEVIAGAMRRIADDRPAMLIEILNRDIGDRLGKLLPEYVFFEIGEAIVRTDCPGGNADRNCLVLHHSDPRLSMLGDGVANKTLSDWLR